MRKLKITKAAIVAAIVLCGAALAHAGFSLSIGTDNFYLSVGNYDYYPYAMSHDPYYRYPRISFYDVLSDYGHWVYVSPFGKTWRPYAAPGWRPYVYGRWVNSIYGPYWIGYEPWAWVGYHYGSWIWTYRYGWVWVPGYEWHPGRVIWSHGYGTIGWMPAPPWGYDYSYGYLSYRGDYNQFGYYDRDFGISYGYYGNYGYDRRYQDLYYSPGYRNIVSHLWIFVQIDHIGYQSYSDCYLDGDYVRNAFERRHVRISSQPLQRTAMDQVFKQKVPEVQVREREWETSERRLRMVVPVGQEETIRKNANRVVEEVIAPGFVENKRTFKGTESRNVTEVNKLFHQERSRPVVRQMEANEVVRQAKEVEEKQKEKRIRITRERTEADAKAEKDFKSRESRGKSVQPKPAPEVDVPVRESDRNRKSDNSQRSSYGNDRSSQSSSRASSHDFERDSSVTKSERSTARYGSSRENESDRARSERGSQERLSHVRPDSGISSGKSEDARSPVEKTESRSGREDREKEVSRISEKEKQDAEKQRNEDQTKMESAEKKNEKQDEKEKDKNRKAGKESNSGKRNKPDKRH